MVQREPRFYNHYSSLYIVMINTSYENEVGTYFKYLEVCM